MENYTESLELEHYGVKGMKWGVRKKIAPNYSDRQRSNDARKYGKRSVSRINSQMVKGKNIKQARKTEAIRQERVKKARGVFERIGKVSLAVAYRAANLGILMKKGPEASLAFTLGTRGAYMKAQKIGNYVTEPLRKKK